MTLRARRLFPIAVVAAAALALSGCAGGEAEAPEPDAQSDGAFPAVVDTAFGEVTVPEQPQRVVALGWGDAETALALGVQPVGASDWLAFGGDGVGPWAEGMYDEAPEIIETLEPSYEQIAALDPDLILDVKSSGDEQRNERLSEIAPTVGVPEGGESYLTGTQKQVEMISAALGVPEEGDRLLDELEASYDEAVAANPEFEGKTATVAAYTSEGWGAYIADTDRVRFIERLGFEQNPAIEELPVDGFSVNVSDEQLELLDADVLVTFPIYVEDSAVTDQPLYQSIPAVEDGHAIVLGGDIGSAYSLSSILSLGFAIDEVVPLLADAVAGDAE